MKRSSKSEMSLFKSNEMRGVDKSLILRNRSWIRTFIEENTFRIEKRMNWAQNWMLMQRSSKRRLKSCNKELRKQRNKSLRNSLNLIWSEVQALMTRFVRRRLVLLYDSYLLCLFILKCHFRFNKFLFFRLSDIVFLKWGFLWKYFWTDRILFWTFSWSSFW